MDIRYPAILEPEEGGGFFVRFVDLEDTFTEGATPDEAPFNGAEVQSALLGCRLDHDLPIPDPSPSGERPVSDRPVRRMDAERADTARALRR
mgnify:CR=1 FL=1